MGGSVTATVGGRSEAMWKRKRIGVLMGGRSAEREISLRSGRAVEASLLRQGWAAVAIEVDERVAERLREGGVELVFNALHGRGGEDGTIQGLLESMRIPYTGSGVLASAVGMNKVMTKRLMETAGLPTPPFSVLRRGEGPAPSGLPEGRIVPVVVKPASEGSTIGVTIVREVSGLAPAYAEGFRWEDEILVEQYVEGREVTAGVLEGEALPLIEIIPEDDFYDYRAKYQKGKTKYLVPAPLTAELEEEVRRHALSVYRLLGCRGAARVDFRLDRQDRPFILEINTVPGMTETSLLPKAAEAAGISYDELVARIVRAALPAEKP